MRADPGGPPRLAVRMIVARLPREVGESLAGDLEEEYRLRVLQRRGRALATLWFWWQALTVRGARIGRAARSLEARRPSWEGSRPGGAGHSGGPWHRLPLRPGDVAYAVRRMARSPGFTTVATLSLALGIGANTAMFSLVNAVLVRELPVADPDRLVEVYTSEDDGYPYVTSSQPDYRDLRARDDVFESVVGTRNIIARVDVGAAPRVAIGELVSWDYFQTLGVPLEHGRPFLAEEDETPGTHPVAILGYRSWARDFGGDPDVLGRAVRLNGTPYTVVGVAPETFPGSMPALVSSFYVPLMMTNEITGSTQLERRGSRSMFLKGRLQPGVTVEQANAALAAFSTVLAERFPETNENHVMSALPTGDVALHPLVDRVLTPVAALLMGVVALVLLIACANLASFLLARAEDRRREIAVRLALGAGRGALVRQLLVETLLLGGLGGLAGLALARRMIGALLAFRPPLPLPLDLDVPLDGTVLLFTAAVSAAAGIAFGLVPALQATRPDLTLALKGQGGGSGARRRIGARGMLVVGQVTFSFVLLIGAGLFVRSLHEAQLIDPGFDTGPGAVLWPMPELSGYDTPERTRAFYEALEARLLAHPAVTGVALADRLPLGIGVQTGGYELPGVPSTAPDGEHQIDNATVNPGYFGAMGVEIVAGRGFTEADTHGDPVAVVSRAFVERYYPGEDLLGRVIGDGGGRDLRIVGVAADTKVRTLGEGPRPYVYELHGQMAFFGVQVVVRGDTDAPELVRIAGAALREVDADMVLFEEPKTMGDHLALLLFPPRMAAFLLSAFGGLALLLAAIGIYGVVGHAVSRRTRELGIRMSLGASAGDVVRRAVAGGMKLVAIGGLVGVALAAGIGWAISGFLFGIGPNDVATFVVIPVLLTLVALVAAWVPARRASRVDPVRALRVE